MFRHIRLSLRASNSESIKPLVERLCGLSAKALRVRHLTIVPGECHSSPTRSMLVPILRAFLASPRVIIETLALSFEGAHYDNSLIDILTGFTGSLRRLEIYESHLSSENILHIRTLLLLAPMCKQMTYAQCTDGCCEEGECRNGFRDEDDEDEDDEPRNENHMQILDPSTELDILTFVSPCTQWAPTSRFAIALLQNVRRLEIDTFNIVDFAHVLRSAPGALRKVAEITVTSQTPVTATDLRDLQVDDGPHEYADPWLLLRELVSSCGNLQIVDLVVPCCDKGKEAFNFSGFPESLLSVSLHFDTCRDLPLDEWSCLMDNIQDFIYISQRLQVFALHLPTSAWDRSLCKYGDNVAGHWWRFFDEDREEVLQEEARATCPEAFRRYPFEPLSEADDDFDLDLTDPAFQQWYRARAQRLFLEQTVEECVAQSSEIASSLDSRKIPYTIVVPDFSVEKYVPRKWQHGPNLKSGQKQMWVKHVSTERAC